MKKEVVWWNRLGKPQYGGEIVLWSDRNIVNFDPYYEAFYTQIMWTWMEGLAKEDWTKDPSVFDYKKFLRPNKYRKGQLAESWEFTDPTTFVVHLRKGIYWQDIPPVNGREFTADDVAYHFHRLYGLDNFLSPSPDHTSDDVLKSLMSVTAVDKYTVVFKWRINDSEYIMQSLFAPNPAMVFEAREAVEKWGDLSDWHHAIGTGPFILTDFVSGSSATLIKNHNYWGYDERYPQNKLPYVDTIRLLIIPDKTEALEAMRKGKIDLISPVSLKDAQSMQRTNPEILRIPIPFRPTVSLDPRLDKAPFNDIRVRKAMQMAIDLPAISKDYYHSKVEPNSFAMHFITSSRDMKEWGFPYEEWPQDLKDEYAYNPSASKKLLADAGYPNGFRTNIVADTAGDIDLLQIIKSYFAQVGIDMEIRPMDSVSWHNFVMIGHKHDQMAQRSELPQGHLFQPIRKLHEFHIGHATHRMISDPVCDTFYPKAFAATSLDEVVKIYRDANEYIARQHFSISLLQPPFYALCQPWLKGFNAQFGSIQMHAVLSFYLGRFWIDQKLKEKIFPS